MKYRYKRRSSSEAKAGNVGIGGRNPIRLQSMTNTSTTDIEGSARQIERIAEAGADIVRLTTQGEKEAAAIADIKRALDPKWKHLPLVADVHFTPPAAYKALETCEKVRINPGNFADPAHRFSHIDYTDEEYAAELLRLREKLVPFLRRAKETGTALRLGVNHGSLSDRIVSRYGDTPAGMVESLMEYLRICREEGFNDVVLSIKASNVPLMVQTVKLLVNTMESEGMAYPLHLGVTEAGTLVDSSIKSSLALGHLLLDGIGDTIRISVHGDPAQEIPVALTLLKNTGLKNDEPDLIVCPSCGRTAWNMEPVVRAVEDHLRSVHKDVKVAIMGCVVNGPGEAGQADIAIAGGNSSGALIRHGEIVEILREDQMIERLIEEIDRFDPERRA